MHLKVWSWWVSRRHIYNYIFRRRMTKFLETSFLSQSCCKVLKSESKQQFLRRRNQKWTMFFNLLRPFDTVMLLLLHLKQWENVLLFHYVSWQPAEVISPTRNCTLTNIIVFPKIWMLLSNDLLNSSLVK